MMYKLKHKLFGWDYIYSDFAYARGIAKVVALPDGTIGFWKHGNFYETQQSRSVQWLTCGKNKYFGGGGISVHNRISKAVDDTHGMYLKSSIILDELHDLYRKENPKPNGEFYVPDRKVFYKWIVNKIREQHNEA